MSASASTDAGHVPHPIEKTWWFDGGRLPRGAASVVAGSTSLLLTLLESSQGTSDWVALVGAPDVGLLAAAHAGVALERVALVPRAGEHPADVVAALLDGLTYVVVGPDARLTASEPVGRDTPHAR